MDQTGEGSSNAAQSAHVDEDDDSSKSLIGRLFEVLSGSDSEGGGPSAMVAADGPPHGGMANLTRMRVEDVMLPKVEIVAVPIEIGQGDLVEVFRQSGLTRLPVYKGTLDSPMGMVHLKDFALRHGFNGKSEDFDLSNMLRPLL